jgi:hypothetical protein
MCITFSIVATLCNTKDVKSQERTNVDQNCKEMNVLFLAPHFLSSASAILTNDTQVRSILRKENLFFLMCIINTSAGSSIALSH